MRSSPTRSTLRGRHCACGLLAVRLEKQRSRRVCSRAEAAARSLVQVELEALQQRTVFPYGKKLGRSPKRPSSFLEDRLSLAWKGLQQACQAKCITKRAEGWGSESGRGGGGAAAGACTRSWERCHRWHCRASRRPRSAIPPTPHLPLPASPAISRICCRAGPPRLCHTCSWLARRRCRQTAAARCQPSRRGTPPPRASG